jgi:hypothetical protein
MGKRNRNVPDSNVELARSQIERVIWRLESKGAAMSTCAICGAPATTVVTTRIDESTETAFYCELHAPFPEQSREAAADDLRALSAALHGMLDIMRREGRMPGQAELAAWGAAIRPEPPPSKEQLSAQIAFLEQFVGIMDAHGRLPEASELPPDPF